MRRNMQFESMVDRPCICSSGDLYFNNHRVRMHDQLAICSRDLNAKLRLITTHFDDETN